MARLVGVDLPRDKRVEVALTYAGVHAVWGHRINHRIWLSGHPLVARIVDAYERAQARGDAA